MPAEIISKSDANEAMMNLLLVHVRFQMNDKLGLHFLIQQEPMPVRYKLGNVCYLMLCFPNVHTNFLYGHTFQ